MSKLLNKAHTAGVSLKLLDEIRFIYAVTRLPRIYCLRRCSVIPRYSRVTGTKHATASTYSL